MSANNSHIYISPNKNVIGTVTDISGEALIGVSILVQGTNNGVVTDLNGSIH